MKIPERLLFAGSSLTLDKSNQFSLCLLTRLSAYLPVSYPPTKTKNKTKLIEPTRFEPETLLLIRDIIPPMPSKIKIIPTTRLITPTLR
jgi:hypothetical protein